MRFDSSRFLSFVPKVNMTPAEHVAERTWSTLRRAKQLRARFGEETLTDLLVLDMLPYQHIKGFWLDPLTKHHEGRYGADLLVAVRHQTGNGSLLALQAKKLYPDDRYQMLNRVTESRDQLDKLEGFARQFRARPLYLLYNHSNTARSEHWNCCRRSFAKRQLGCTLVPSGHIRRMLLRPPPPRDFHSAHKVKQAKPWRCVFDCQSAEKELRQMALPTPPHYPGTSPADAPDYRSFELKEDAWPEWLSQIPGTRLTTKDVDQLRSYLSALKGSVAEDARRESIGSDERLYPVRLLIVDRSQE